MAGRRPYRGLSWSNVDHENPGSRQIAQPVELAAFQAARPPSRRVLGLGRSGSRSAGFTLGDPFEDGAGTPAPCALAERDRLREGAGLHARVQKRFAHPDDGQNFFTAIYRIRDYEGRGASHVVGAPLLREHEYFTPEVTLQMFPREDEFLPSVGVAQDRPARGRDAQGSSPACRRCLFPGGDGEGRVVLASVVQQEARALLRG